MVNCYHDKRLLFKNCVKTIKSASDANVYWLLRKQLPMVTSMNEPTSKACRYTWGSCQRIYTGVTILVYTNCSERCRKNLDLFLTLGGGRESGEGGVLKKYYFSILISNARSAGVNKGTMENFPGVH